MQKDAAMRRNREHTMLRRLLAIVALLAGAGVCASAQSYEPHTGQPAAVKQIASDLYFFYDYDGSNSVFLVTDAGVLVIDTREHPRAAQDYLTRIRKVTDKPIKWVINSHF